MNQLKVLKSSPESEVRTHGAPAGAYAARVPLARAAAAQGCALLVVVVLAGLVPDAPADRADVMAWALLQGGLAALLGRALGMDSWWLAIHTFFAPGLVWMLGLALPPYIPLAAFCTLASVYWGVSHSRVPLFLSSRAATQAVAELLPSDRPFKFVDLGSGLGGMLSRLARAHPQGEYRGVESAPLPFLLSRLRTLMDASAWQVAWGDLREIDLAEYDVVYAYLSPAAMPDLWEKARHEMRTGSLLISNSFAIPGVTPAYTVATGGRQGARLMIWRM